MGDRRIRIEKSNIAEGKLFAISPLSSTKAFLILTNFLARYALEGD